MTRPDRTRLTCRDNGGVLGARTVNRTGGAAVASLTRVVPGRKLARGDLWVFAVVAGARRTRRTGTSAGWARPGGVPLRRDGGPLPGRVYLPVWLESRWGFTARVALLGGCPL